MESAMHIPPRRKFVSNIWITLIIAFSILMSFPDSHSFALECSPSQQSFELLAGFRFKAPINAVRNVLDIFNLTECLSFCKYDATCQAISFETGLCVLFNSSAQEHPESFISSQLPALTMFAQEKCLGELTCSSKWVYERVPNYKLFHRSKRIVPNISSIEKCMELCLKERSFQCRSANYNRQSNECQMNDADRYSLQSNVYKYFIPAEDGAEYLENNCVDNIFADNAKRLCQFSAISGKILQTVDAVFANVKTVDGCGKKCLSADFRCRAFDLGHPQNKVCRLSHFSSASLSHVQSPYLKVLGSTTYEVSSCYDITTECGSREMVTVIRTSKMFGGKVYAKSRHRSCVTDVHNSTDFEIRMGYQDFNCDVTDQGNGEFTNEIFIQHHDKVITKQDLGVKVHCKYDQETNKSLTSGIRLGADSEEIDPYPSYGRSVPKISMRLTDGLDQDLSSAQLGDTLLLKLRIIDKNSPYDIVVRELIATDSADTSEIILINDNGCPTDPLIMGPVTKINDNGGVLQMKFKAFKFPTSNDIQFKTLVQSCLTACTPADCELQTSNGLKHQLKPLGKKELKPLMNRTRRRTTFMEDAVVVGFTLHITEKNEIDEENPTTKPTTESVEDIKDISGNSSSKYNNTANLALFITPFLFTQLTIIFTWAFIMQKRLQRSKRVVSSVFSIENGPELYVEEKNFEDRPPHSLHQNCVRSP